MKKKRKLTFLLVAIALFVGLVSTVSAATGGILHQERTQYFYNRQKTDGTAHHSGYMKHYTIDGEVAYCIEPDILEGTSYQQGSWEDTGLPDSIKERLLLIGYYGYTYPGHETEEYRAATQGMLWDEIVGGGTNTEFTSDLWGKGSKFDVSGAKAEINRLIEHHFDRPSFNGDVYKVQKGQALTLTDTNNVLDQFDISVSGAEIEKNGNTITITPTTSGTIDISFTKKMPYSASYKLFVGNGIQNMLVPGMVDPVIAKVRINSYTSTVEITKKDKETNSTTAQGQATLKGARYGIYEQTTGELVDVIETDENGYAKSNHELSWNSYYLQEISPSEGYLLDNTKYNFDMRGKENEKIDVFETVVKNYISILKQYDYVDGNTTFLNAEKDITFEIYYPNGNKYGEITTDKNGYATINLPYGVWKLHQVNTTSGYEKIYDFYITVDYNSEKEQYYNILNNSLNAYLQVFKVDAETGKTIALADTTFKIFNKDKNEYVSQFVGGKVYDEFKTDEDGKFTTYLKLESGNYKLIEVSSPKGYLIDKNGIDFTIGNETHFSYTNYGAFITMYVKNTPIKGKIEIHKNGELFVAEDYSFNYNGRKNLEGIVYDIYAEEDIKSADGNYLYYEAGTLVGTMTTDKDGYAVSEILPLGKYIIKETKTNELYVLDKTEYHIELTEIDNETAIVYSSNEMTNALKKGTLEFTKTDLVTGETIPNTIIEVYTENNQRIFTGKTDENGKIIIENLSAGQKYYILEKEPATGYVITDEVVYFEITEDGEVIKAEMKNKPITGKLEFTKVDFSTNEPIPNTLIEIYSVDDEENPIFSGRTDENGKITIDELRYGKYYILEKETASPDYVLNTERMYFEILEDGEVVRCTMINELAPIEVPNTGIEDSHIFEIVGVLLLLVGFGGTVYAIKKKRK